VTALLAVFFFLVFSRGGSRFFSINLRSLVSFPQGFSLFSTEKHFSFCRSLPPLQSCCIGHVTRAERNTYEEVK
jgi:hypothetical protein